MKAATCVQIQEVINGFTLYPSYHLCGRTAQWSDKSGRNLCGIHRLSVDKSYERTKDEFRCQPIHCEASKKGER